MIPLALALTLLPTADVWVYPHAADQTSDPFLRVWGGGDYEFGRPSPGSFDFSVSLLRFTIPAGTRTPLSGARLVVVQEPDPAFTEAEAASAPLRVRAATSAWSEQGWQFEKAAEAMPKEADPVLGASARPTIVQGRPVELVIDLAATEAGRAWLAARQAGETVNLMLSSRINPDSMGEGKTYKFGSRQHEDESRRPRLVLIPAAGPSLAVR
ncbi:MAG: hypothetical protein MH204_09385 [Fimbriimonadaceae bacterium]|nr:hypothetical protein [Fimbriimonadaceae bacterium]